MQSTHAGNYLPYLGVDLTSRYAISPRPIDVCGLTLADSQTLVADFWQWRWGSRDEPIAIDALLPEIQHASIIMIDGPHAFAKPGERVRSAERTLRTPGRTPSELPSLHLPYAGFIHSSLELFSVFRHHGLAISYRTGSVSIFECYPAAAWKNLSPFLALRSKRTREGRNDRCQLLQRLGVVWSHQAELSHDQIDACLCAVISAAMDDRLAKLNVSTVGEPLYIDRAGNLREGPICSIHPAC